MEIRCGEPFSPRNTTQLKILAVELAIDTIAIGDETLEFESEGPLSLTKEKPTRDVYFHSDQHGEDELVFFSLELRDNQVYLSPGNSNIRQVHLRDVGSVCSLG